MAASSNVLSVAGGVRMETCSFHSNKIENLGSFRSKLPMHQKSKRLNQMQKLSVRSVRAEYGGGSKGGGGDFFAGFFLGGVVFGTLAYVFAPQIRRSILNEDEYGFQRPRRPIYYEDDGGLEKTRQTLNAKIRQLNSAIDNVSSRLRGGKKIPVPEPIEADPGFEATV